MVVTDIAVLADPDNPYIYPSDPRMIRIPVDLNQGAGGSYIYLAYLKGGEADPITALYVLIQDDKEPINAPSGYTPIATDLNEGAGGDYVYLCYRRKQNPNDHAIDDLNVIAGNSGTPPVPDGWTLVPGDLNAGAGGRYIHLIYR